jgi:hypothetical protein
MNNTMIGSGHSSSIALNQVTFGTGLGITTNSFSHGITLGTTDRFNGTSFNLHNENYKKYEIYELNEDLLVLSCVAKRLRETKKSCVSNDNYLLLNSIFFREVSPEDRNKAEIIRDYYSKKIMMLKLKGTKLTQFREDLNKFIHGDGTKVTENFFQLVYRLPDFYEYDTGFEDIYKKSECELKIETPPTIENFILKPTGKLHKKTKANKTTEYWFKTQYNILAMIAVEPKNELLSIWDHLFETKSIMKIKGKTFVKHIDENEYLSIKKWELTEI